MMENDYPYKRIFGIKSLPDFFVEKKTITIEEARELYPEQMKEFEKNNLNADIYNNDTSKPSLLNKVVFHKLKNKT